LDEGGEHILMAIATWLPEENPEKICGYVSYSYRIDVISYTGKDRSHSKIYKS
jgi:hypothetical protein